MADTPRPASANLEHNIWERFEPQPRGGDPWQAQEQHLHPPASEPPPARALEPPPHATTQHPSQPAGRFPNTYILPSIPPPPAITPSVGAATGNIPNTLYTTNDAFTARFVVRSYANKHPHNTLVQQINQQLSHSSDMAIFARFKQEEQGFTRALAFSLWEEQNDWSEGAVGRRTRVEQYVQDVLNYCDWCMTYGYDTRLAGHLRDLENGLFEGEAFDERALRR